MSSVAPYRARVHLLIILVCVLVCEGKFLDFGQHKHEGDDVYEGGGSLQRAQAILEFPALDEMNSAERAANRQRARKVATIIEKSIHMLANDILQMWTITQTGEDTGDRETEDKGEAEFVGGKSSKVENAETTDVADAEAVGGPGVNIYMGGLAKTQEGAVSQQATEGIGAKKIEGSDSKTTEAVKDEKTEVQRNDSEGEESSPLIQKEGQNSDVSKNTNAVNSRNPKL